MDEHALSFVASARVLVVGAGGLGSPVLQYLAAAGVGVVGLVDGDVVDLSNLQRQVIHPVAEVGQPKTDSASRAISALNPEVRVIAHPIVLDSSNALEILRDYDLVVDASDNLPTRYLLSDACALLGLPLVWGAVLGYDGAVTVFWDAAPDDPAGASRRLDYRDLHPAPPDPASVLSCAQAGVLGPVCGVIGSAMATEVLKLITGVGEPLLGRLQQFNGLSGEWRSMPIRRRPDRMPVSGLIDYEQFCGVGPADAREIDAREIDAAELDGYRLIDVREPAEHEVDHLDGDELIPLARLLAEPALAGDAPVAFYCQTGVRSARAAAAVIATGRDAVSLRGGLTRLRRARAQPPAKGGSTSTTSPSLSAAERSASA